VRQENEFRFLIDKISDQPRTSNAIDLNFLARDPSHAAKPDVNRGRSN